MLAGVLRSNHHQMFRTGMCFAHLFSPRAAGLPKVELRPIQLVIGLREFAAPPRQGACHSRGSWAGAWPGQRRSTWSSCRRPATSEAVPPALFSAVPAAQVPCVPAEVQPGQVHVWWMHPHSHAAAALPAQSQLHARCAALLSPEELAECSTGGSAEARLGRLLVRCFLRSVLARYVAPTGNGGARPASAAALQFVRNAHGKPELASPCTTPSGHRLRFNLTHTGGLVGMAVGAERLVGLDAEWLQRRTQGNVMKLARRRLSQQEVEALEACSTEAERAQLFIQLWTLKEAYVKALGRGISAPPGLRSFAFEMGPSMGSMHPPLPGTHLPSMHGGSSAASASIAFSSAVPELRRWHFALLRATDDHVAALCLERAAGDGPLHLTAFQADPFAEDAQPVEASIVAHGSTL